MSKLTDFYIHKSSLLEKGEPIDPQWELLEDKLLKEELLPELIEQLKTVLLKVKSPLMFSGSYDPNGCLSVSFTRNCVQLSSLSQTAIQGEQRMVMNEGVSGTDVAAETETVEDNIVVTPEQRYTKAKSVGFSVSFRDGTIYHEKKAVNTWILALKKIGLETICNNRSKHTAWHRVNSQDVCIVERSETVRDSDGKSPQTLVDGFYIMSQLSNDQKEKDLLALGEYLPKLGIKVIWDEEPEDYKKPSDKPEKSPLVNEDAFHWNYPIKEQFRAFLAGIKSASTAHSYTSTLDNTVREWVNKLVDENADSVFSYTSLEDVRLCIDILNSSTDFVAENNRKHHSMSAALNQYLLFIEEWEKRFSD